MELEIPLKFDENYFLRGRETGVSNYTDYRWLPELTIPMAAAIKKLWGISGLNNESMLDFGCARGYLVKALRLLGINAFGYDISEWAITNCDNSVSKFVSNHLSFTGYDYLFCKDVLEHMSMSELLRTLPMLLSSINNSALFIVPLAASDNGPYVAKVDEQDITHIQRLTIGTWVKLIESQATNFIVNALAPIPILKMGVLQYPGSAGFIHCRRFCVSVHQ